MGKGREVVIFVFLVGLLILGGLEFPFGFYTKIILEWGIVQTREDGKSELNISW